MRIIGLIFFTCAALLASSNDSELKNISLDLRATYIHYDYDKGFSDAEAFASSLKLKYERDIAYGFSGGVAFGTVQDLGLKLISSKI